MKQRSEPVKSFATKQFARRDYYDAHSWLGGNMRKPLVVITTVTLGLLAASCGSDDDKSSEPSGSASASSVATTAPTNTSATSTSSAESTPPSADSTAASGDCTLTTPLKIGFAADLGELGAFRADVTGAGPVVYGLFLHRAQAEAAQSRLAGRGQTWIAVPAWYG